MTLAGLAIAVGMVVDDAIVYVENIFRRLQAYFRLRWTGTEPEETPSEVVTRASEEIRSSIVFATLIIILVFVPLFSLSGMEGRMFRPLGWAVVISMAASLLVALTVVPVLSDLLLTRFQRLRPSDGSESEPYPSKESPVVVWIKRAYRPILVGVMRLRWVIVAVALLLVVLTVAAIPRLGREFLPVMDEATFIISVFSPPGTSLGESTRIGREMETRLLTIPEVTSVSSRTGRAEADEHAHDVNTHEILVNFIPPDEREENASRTPRRSPDVAVS